MTIDYIPGTTSNLVGDPAEGGAFSSGNKGELSGANTAAANAATSATAAAASQTAAAQSASDLSAAEANAGLSAVAAATSATAAAADRSATQGFLGTIASLYDQFDDRYLGSKTSEPTLDNDGGALLVGAMYFNSTSNLMKVYNGSAWQVTAVDSTTILLKAQNLADLPSVSTARTNLGLGTMALEAAADYALLAGATFTGDVTAPEFIGVLQGETVFKAKAGEALVKGDAVYVSGVSGNTPVVSKADANGTNTYPAFGLAAATTANNGTLDVITAGQLKNIDTSGFALGDTLYLSTTPGALTATPPSGEGSVIQNMGKVEREHASVGSILVVGAGRTAATPNLNDGNVFIGNSSNKAVTSSFNTLADARIANNIIDEDGFGTNSATRAPSQQSVKQYVADQTANIQGDITNVITGNGLTGGGTSGAVTIAVDTAVVATAGNTLSLNNKTLNTPDINSPDINGGTIDGTVIGGATPAAGTFTTIDSVNKITATRADNGINFHAISTDADENNGPIMDFERISASPADGDNTGIVNFKGRNDADETATYAQLFTEIIDASNGSEDGRIEIRTLQNGTLRPGLTLFTNNGQPEVSVNGYSADVDFRVKGASQAALIFADSSENKVGIKTETPSTDFQVNGDALFATATVTGALGSGDITITDASPKLAFIDSDGTNQKTEQVQAGGSFVTTVRNNTSHGSIDFKSNNGTNNLLRFRVATDGDFNFYKNDGSTVGVKWDAPNGRLGIGTTTPSAALDVVGKIETSEGIYLGGTGGSNLLDDYEEGTWTPVMRDATSGGNVAGAANLSGVYTKIGRHVNLTVRVINVSNTGMTGSNDVYITGLPFAAADLSPSFRHVGTVESTRIDYGSSIQSRITENTSYMILSSSTNVGGLGTINWNAVDDDESSVGVADLFITHTYIAD
jgi:hypothetical protein